MKVTFNLTCTLLLGLHDEPTKEALLEDFTNTMEGLWALPVNIPGTTYHKASSKR